MAKKKSKKMSRNAKVAARANELAAKKRKIPRQPPLPGIGDEKIAAIENAALDYAEIRDQRQELTLQEVELKSKLLDLMHAKKLTEYKRNGISVKIEVESEKIKVRVTSEEELPADSKPEVDVNLSEAVNA